jgi:uncharacterized protein YdgA (DUF945 family)
MKHGRIVQDTTIFQNDPKPFSAHRNFQENALKRKNIFVAAATTTVVVILAAGYPASSWYFGRQIETAHKEIDAHIATLPFVKLVRHDYERSLFEARETVVVELPGTLAKETTDSKPVRITLKNFIQHGPFPGYSTFAAGKFTGVVEFDEDIQKKVLEAFGGKPAMEIQTVYGFGDGHFTLTSPAFQVSLSNEEEGPPLTLSGDGLELTGEFSRGLARYSMHGSAPRFEMSDREGRRMALTGFQIDTQQQRLFPDELLFAGSQRLSLAGLEIDPGANEGEDGPPKLALKDVKYEEQTQATGEFIDVNAQSSAAGLRIGEQEHGPVVYDYSLKHLHARTLGTLSRKLSSMDAETLRGQKRLAKAFEPMKGDFIALLANDAILSIDRVAFHLPEGEVKFNASFRLDGGKTEDFDRPLRLLEKLDVTAELALPGKSVGAFLGGTDAENEEEARKYAETVEEIVARLVQQGYVADDNGILGTRLVFNKGQLLLNDKPFNPMTLLIPQSSVPGESGNP